MVPEHFSRREAVEPFSTKRMTAATPGQPLEMAAAQPITCESAVLSVTYRPRHRQNTMEAGTQLQVKIRTTDKTKLCSNQLL